MKAKIGVLLVVLLSLTACEVPSPRQRALLNSMLGATQLDVVRRFGVPSRTYEAGGHTFLAYIENETNYSPGTPGWGWGWGWNSGWGGGPWDGPWSGTWGGGFGGIPPTFYYATCQTTFELERDRVLGWTMRGDGC